MSGHGKQPQSQLGTVIAAIFESLNTETITVKRQDWDRVVGKDYDLDVKGAGDSVTITCKPKG